MKTRKRTIFVTALILIFAICFYINVKGEYLQILGIGEEYLEIFRQNYIQRIIIYLICFCLVYAFTYITTVFMKKGFKKFFEEDKITMPKLPNKSISLAFGIIWGLIVSSQITEKAILAFNSAKFGISDPIFNIDIGYYVFQKPFIETAILYLIITMALLTIYVVVYYIIVFNRFFDKGISIETFKKNTFLKQLVVNASIIIILISIFTLVNIQDIVLDKFITIDNETDLYGAGITDVTIKMWGYAVFAILIPICAFMAVSNLKKQKNRKALMNILIIPIYLIILFLIMVLFDLIFVNSSELDRQKTYIENNIKFTKSAYNIDIEEEEIVNTGTITNEDISDNKELIENINLLNKKVILENLQEYQTSLGYYTFPNTKIGLYNNQLVYLTPREIVSNNTRTYNNKTYEYTHGYGVIVTSASNADDTGYLKYIKSGFTEADDGIIINEPRIYFGTQTNEPIVINQDSETEYDYPLTSTTNSYNTYKGEAGLNLNFLDRLILGIKEKNIKFAFSTDVTSDSKIIADRNIIERAKMVMPYLIYDEEPYLVVTNDGNLVWVLDAYTVSNNYPYSQKTTIVSGEGTMKEINYIRNSVKVLIDAYNGNMEFYITDRDDPIIMAYWNMYPSLFQDIDKASLPEDVSEHVVYSEYLYNIQAKVLNVYHDVQSEVLYRGDDIWSFAKVNTNSISNSAGTELKPYYTMVKEAKNGEAKLGLVIPYTKEGKQNIVSYLIGTYDTKTNKNILKMYRFVGNETILGTNQLDALVNEDDTISKEIEALNLMGTSIEKDIIVVPINNALLYVEPIYQIKLNENKVPVLKKVVVASGNKVAIGNDLAGALKNLLSQEAVSIDVEGATVEELMQEIIKANDNLKNSNESNDWELMGKDIARLQELINELDELVNEEKYE